MVGGVFYEHGHRMVAATVGLLTIALTLWTRLGEPRSWVRRLAVIALCVVVVQGVLGGATVLLGLPLAVSVTHACLAQAFLCIIVTIAECTGRAWVRPPGAGRQVVDRAPGRVRLEWLSTGFALLVYVQLLIGATMRHMGAGLAIPDFPLAFGGLIPPLASPGIVVHFAHRLGALTLIVAAVWIAGEIARRHPTERQIVGPAAFVVGLVMLQVSLGAVTIWTRRAVVPTSAHVMVGAAILATSVVLALRVWRDMPGVRRVDDVPLLARQQVT
jgi:cytochrome c oxidase assembly protein subunit 15